MKVDIMSAGNKVYSMRGRGVSSGESTLTRSNSGSGETWPISPTSNSAMSSIVGNKPLDLKSDKQGYLQADSLPQKNHVTFQRTYKVTYLGYAVLDRRYTLPMLPWIIAETKRHGLHNSEDIFLEVTESSMKAVSTKDNEFVFEHKLQTISRFSQTSLDHKYFSYLTKESQNGPSACHVFQATDESTVVELFTTMREMSKEMAQQHGLSMTFSTGGGRGGLDTMLGSCQHYEVMYLGKIKISQKRTPPIFIDDAVEKFRLYDLEKCRGQQQSSRQRHGSGASVSSLPYSLDMVEHPKENELAAQMSKTTSSSKETLSSNSSSRQSSTECVTTESLDTVSKDEGMDSSDSYLQSPVSPLGSVEQLNRVVSPTHSLITHTQSMDNNSSAAFIQDLREYAALNAASQNSLQQPPFPIIHSQSLDAPCRAAIVQELQDCGFTSTRVRSCSGDMPRPSKQTSLPTYRTRLGSGGLIDLSQSRLSTLSSRQQHNRTMLFLIGRQELCLISTDRKQVLLSKTFSDIAHCSQGIRNTDHFGFTCRETSPVGSDYYAGYVFRCQTDKVVDDLMKSLKQAFNNAHHEYQQLSSRSHITICELCPMHWYHKLCVEIEGHNTDKTHAVITQKITSLPNAEREEILKKYEAIETNNFQEKNEIFMMLLRSLCEQKQLKHSHVINGSHSNKYEVGFLKDKASSSKFDSLKQKAKKSLSSSFETILKRKGAEYLRERAVTNPLDTITYTLTESSEDTIKDKAQSNIAYHREGSYDAQESSSSGRLSPSQRPRSSTISTSREVQKEARRRISTDKKPKNGDAGAQQAKSPIMNIFMKVGHQKTSSTQKDSDLLSTPKGSWRQAIFHRVQTPVQQNTSGSDFIERQPEDDSTVVMPNGDAPISRRSKAELRALWKKAILEQILLIRMERENKKLQVSQDAVSHKRMKLDYEEITPCLKESVNHWEEMLTHPDRKTMNIVRARLQELVKSGVPRHKRGDIWQFLAEQQYFCHNLPECGSNNNINLQIPYEDLLKHLTSHQHAILLDLGRTFPNHPFYAQSLGPGQLALFNLLKAYSLLDKEVGYCQGLSFVAGVLLLHMPEERAFQMMKHILFNLGFRCQYKPDMMALQIQMYQLSRLVHDNYREVYEHFERYEIAPTLYAAPWFLTLFASQYPLGFVSRLFDLIFLQGMEAIFKVALVLLGEHRDLILQCHGFETIMEFLKTTLPSMGIIQMERVFNQVFTLDLSKQLHAYEVEYHVLQEEMFLNSQRAEADAIQKLEAANKGLKRQNQELQEQLQVANSTVFNLESSVLSHQSTIKRLEARVRGLEDERDALMHSVRVLRRRVEQLEVAQLEAEAKNFPDDSRPPSLSVISRLSSGGEKDDDSLLQMVKDLGLEEEEKKKASEEDEDGGEVFFSAFRHRTPSSGSVPGAHNTQTGGSL